MSEEKEFIEKAKEARKHLSVFYKIVRLSCRRCQNMLLREKGKMKEIGTLGVEANIKDIMDNKLCKECKDRKELIMKNYENANRN